MSEDAQQLIQLIRESVTADRLQKAVLSKPADRNTKARRIDVRPVQLRGRRMYQFASRIGAQEHHRNLDPAAATAELTQLAQTVYRDLLLQTPQAVWNARHNRRGQCSLKRTAAPAAASDSAAARQEDRVVQPAAHDRTRQYLIPDGVPVPFLVATGIMSTAGRVRAKHFRKFRQINRYVEFVRDVADRLPVEGPIRVVDFGCGKSYLTFATHYYLTQILQRPVQITGLDVRPDVVQTCQQIVSDLQLNGLQFAVGEISAWQPSGPVDLTISLHACDTATDDALAKAVAWGSQVILAVPCCQHELAAALPTDVQPLLSRHGILHERFCALATDAVRAELLEQVGYTTTVQEFIDMQHTAKNVLIRSIRRTSNADSGDPAASRRPLAQFSDTFQLPTLRLQRQLEEYGLLSPEPAIDDSCRNC